MHWLSLFRIIALAWTLLCGLVLLGVGGHAVSVVGELNVPTFSWAGLGVATGVLSLLLLPVMLVLDFIRTGAFTSMIVVEMAGLSVLGVLFLATGGSAASNASVFWGSCDLWSPDTARTLCGEASAAAAFGFLGWLALWAYTGTLLIILIIHAQRGNYIWQRSLKEVDWNARGGSNGGVGPVQPHMQTDQSYVPEEAKGVYPPTPVLSPQPTGYTQQSVGYNNSPAYSQQGYAGAQPHHPQV